MAAQLKMNLPSADDLFSTQETRDEEQHEKVQNIPLTLIDPFPEHPFHVCEDETMRAMVESVKAVGVQTPLIVRAKYDGRYELISGHRRKFAAALAGCEALPCIVRQMACDEAVIAMVDANLQREVILPSEKAFSYKMKLDALNRQGKRTDLTSTPMVSKLRTNEEVGQKAGDSREQVRRFIRLTALIPALLLMVDYGKMAFRPAVELSYLPEKEQVVLLDIIEAEAATPSLAQAYKMKHFSQEGKLTPEVMQSILQEEKPNQREKLTFSPKKFESYFKPGTPVEAMEKTILQALDLWKKREKQRQRDVRG